MRPTLFDIPLIWWNIPIRGYGLMLMIGFLGGTWWAARRAWRVKADPDTLINLAFVSLLSSVVGARIFYVIHYWDENFAGRGLWSIVNITAGGLEFYGGFIGAFVAGTIFLLVKKVSWRLYADIAAPSIMFGMSMARIGCFLNGCCWGAPCPADMAWGVKFPYGSAAYVREWENRQITVPAELMAVTSSGAQAYPLPREWIEKAAANPKSNEPVVRDVLVVGSAFGNKPADLLALINTPGHRSQRLHPTQLYSSIDGMLCAILLNAYFYRRKRQGTVFTLLLILYPIMRIFEESIRIDNPHDTAFLTISQFVSVLLVVLGAGIWLALLKQPLRSPLAVPFVPAWEKAESQERGRKKR